MQRPANAVLVVLLAAAFAAPLKAGLPPWTLEVDRLTLADVHITEIRASSGRQGEGQVVELNAGAIVPGAARDPYGPFRLSCPGDIMHVLDALCQGGSWSLRLADAWPLLEGSLGETSVQAGETAASTQGNFGGMAWSAQFRSTDATTRLSLRVPEQSLQSLEFLEPWMKPLAWVSAGALEASAEIAFEGSATARVSAKATITGLDFDSPEGVYAGLGVSASLNARADSVPGGAVQLEGRLDGGELLLGDFYRDFSGGGLAVSARLVTRQDHIEIRRLTVGDGESLHLAGEARLPLGEAAGEPVILLRELRLQFPQAYQRYLESVAAVFTLDGLETGGTLTWTGDWSPGTARSGELRLENLSVVDAGRGRFAVENLAGTLTTGADSRLSWEAASFERLDLGPGSTLIALSPESVRLLEPLRIDVFGGKVAVDQLALEFPRDREPEIALQVAIEDIEMRQMSAALGWPEFGGTLDGRIPGVNWSAGVIEVEGALEFNVFDGRVLLTDLRVERPFGVLPSLAANMTAEALNLEPLTQTFEFGRIAGRLDGYVRDLRMLDWQPVQFDAWFGTPEGAGRNDISRQAVRHLATIGGGSPTALLTGPVLRLFNNFSYRRLGLGCRLQDNICHIRGIEDQGEGVLLLEGAGIPKISILAYNRAVDWPQLVAELTAVSGGEEVRIGN